ncbi:hypothetical protein [Stutzerimonas kunmingensis]|uniref:hypothetical protein n=1 Tax=Stutzerimonas kunmingensis TaxID=1211807 RepID=UPI002106E00E|nr:hypothetical protein [Stutzerimonas kunmingensis]MCQ2034438.1 hypothetical protein [Stutzerimonas kunmingensis]
MVDQVIAEHAVPAGYVLMPKTLTAENGAKAALIGEFTIRHEVTCSGCAYDEADDDCEVCGGEIEYTERVTVPWDVIKDIYAAAVKACGTGAAPAAPRPPAATEDSARLEFMLERHRTVVVELLPSRGDCGKYAIYVEEGFMRDKQYPSVGFTVTGALRADDEAFKKAKFDAIDAAIAAQGADV